MFRPAILIACPLAMLLVMAGCKQKAAQGGPRWVCDQPIIDYGEIWVDTMVQRQFTFRNAGNEVLKLGKPLARCSCSTAPDYPKEVPPGGTGSITYVLNTNRKPYGQCVEYISFPTNDPVTPKAQVTLKGFIRTALEPEVVYDAIAERDKAEGKVRDPHDRSMEGALFGRVKATDQLHRIIKLHNTSGRPLSLTMQPPPPTSLFKVDLKETKPGEEYELTVKVDPPIPVGQLYHILNLQTNVPEQPVYQLYMAAEVPRRVEVIPPTRMLIDQDAYPQSEREIRIINNGSTPVDVVAISTSEPRFDIKLLPRNPAKPQEQVIHIGLPGGTSYRPPAYGELIEVRTNDPEVPIAQIEVVASLTAPPTRRPPDKPLQMYPVELPKAGS
ncbi:MAG TPA: DUF1573 domain-containing protein [Phycisphaerae bacterium]|nr:DUF1573 domain-containing protein [Phycisphaerae bacterium]